MAALPYMYIYELRINSVKALLIGQAKTAGLIKEEPLCKRLE
jgi:hypothetical protein